jgi:hypothetical protein
LLRRRKRKRLRLRKRRRKRRMLIWETFSETSDDQHPY